MTKEGCQNSKKFSFIQETARRLKNADFNYFNRISLERKKLEDSLDETLTAAVLTRDISSNKLNEARNKILQLKENNITLASIYNEAQVVSAEEINIPLSTLQIISLRLINLIENMPTLQYLHKCVINANPNSKLFHLAAMDIPPLQEALSLLPSQMQPVGIEIESINGNDINITLYINLSNHIYKLITVLSDQKRKQLEQFRQSKKILIAVEGDIAGHAVRALQTAIGLRTLGYKPDVIGGGYFMSSFSQEGFHPLTYIDSTQNEERAKIIARARGDKGGLFFWNFSTVRQRVRELKKILYDYVQQGIDIFISDMNPLADIAMQIIKEERDINFPCLTETHDISLSGSRVLESVKVGGIPLGSIISKLELSHLARLCLTDTIKARLNNFIFDQIANLLMGLPLAATDHLRRSKRKTTKKRYKFTDYLHGLDGTLLFSLNTTQSTPDHFPIGLQAERTNSFSSIQKDIPIPTDTTFILNSQGSTYNTEVWSLLVSILQESNCFSISSTGKKEDPLTEIHNFLGSLTGYVLGYIDGYHFSQKANILVHHGGYGTISQWIMGVVKRINDEKQKLLEMMTNSDLDLEAIKTFLASCVGTSRSIAVCNTFEQENNARALNEIGGNSICYVTLADKILKSDNPKETLKKIIANSSSAAISVVKHPFYDDRCLRVV